MLLVIKCMVQGMRIMVFLESTCRYEWKAFPADSDQTPDTCCRETGGCISFVANLDIYSQVNEYVLCVPKMQGEVFALVFQVFEIIYDLQVLKF